MSKLDGESMDIKKMNIEKLKEIFPEVVSDGKIDFDKLKQLLGEYVDDSDERYRFVWNGKGAALRLSQTPSMGTLRPAKKESKNWDNTENLYIEGDNLEVLKLLQKSYFGKIKMIYIDPPYNTGNDFVYPDDYKDNLKNYKKITGQIDENGRTITTNPEYSGRYHTDWLNMMYPRLRLAKNLLSDDGVILINIDENEVHNLKKVCDEIFGENNNLGEIIWDKRNPKGDSKGISCQHEYILIFSKDKNCLLKQGPILRPKKNANEIMNKAEEILKQHNIDKDLNIINQKFREWISRNDKLTVGEKAYNKIDKYGNVYREVSMAWPNKQNAPEDYKKPLIHPITGLECKIPSRGWRYPSNTMKKLLEKDMILFGNDENTIPNRKYLLSENMYENISSLLYFGGSDTELLAALDIPFDTPKVTSIVSEHIQSFTNENDIILDFFSGSATTAHAVMDLNAEDGGNRKYIMVQLPEPTDEKSEAYKAGYENVSEIGKERIRRAGDKIKEELEEKYNNADEKERQNMKKPEDLDIGFKVFKLDSSNIKEWNPGKYEDIQMAIEDSLNPYVEGRTEEDIIYEMMLKMGVNLTYPIEEHKVNGKTIYSIGFGSLMICLSKDIDLTVAQKMIELKKEYDPEIWRVIFRDDGFNSDMDKTNVKETLKAAGLLEESFLTL